MHSEKTVNSVRKTRADHEFDVFFPTGADEKFGFVQVAPCLE